MKDPIIGEPRTCVLHKGKKGFGFVLRGAKAASPLMEMIPSDRCPSLQYMDDVDPGGVADMAGVCKGDFLLKINSDDVTQASHEQVVNLIRKSGDLVALTMVTVTIDLPSKAVATLPNPRHFSTLPRKPMTSGARSPLQHPPPPPKRDPNTTLSVGRARAKSMIANMAAIEALDSAIKDHDKGSLAEQATLSEPDLAPPVGSGSKSQSQPTTPKSEHPAKGKTVTVAQELELIFQREAGLTAGTGFKDKNSLEILKTNAETKSSSANSTPLSAKKKVYTSVAQMKRSKRGPGELLHKDFHSTPELQGVVEESSKSKSEEEQGLPDLEEVLWEKRKSQSEEDLHLASQESNGEWAFPKKDNADHPGYFTLPHKKSATENGYRTLTRIRPVPNKAPTMPESSPISGPAPSHPPPPPPPQTQVVTLDNTSRPPSDYARVGVSQEVNGPVSSFKPASNARLYESPQNVSDIGYKSPDKTNNGETAKKRSPTRTHSLPPRPSRPMVLKRIEQVFLSLLGYT